MFTGIITGVGRITAVHDLGSSFHHGKRLTIQAPAGYLSDVGLGDSIALNGACMTVTSFDPLSHQFTIDISAESLDKTAGLTQLGPINLEKALRAHDRLGGHIGVQSEPGQGSELTLPHAPKPPDNSRSPFLPVARPSPVACSSSKTPASINASSY